MKLAGHSVALFAFAVAFVVCTAFPLDLGSHPKGLLSPEIIGFTIGLVLVEGIPALVILAFDYVLLRGRLWTWTSIALAVVAIAPWIFYRAGAIPPASSWLAATPLWIALLVHRGLCWALRL